MVNRGLLLHETTAAETPLDSLVQLAGGFKKAWAKLRNNAGRISESRSHPRRKPFFTPSTIRPGSFVVAPPTDITTVGSPHSASLPSPTDNTSPGCTGYGYQDTLSAAIGVLRLAYQTADIGHIPLLRGIIGTVLDIAMLIMVSTPPPTILCRP